MARTQKSLSFESSRLDLDSTEEVRVGAYARRQLRRRIMLGVFGAGLIAGGFALYYQLRPRRVGTELDRYPVRVRCDSCGYTGEIQVPFAQTFPMVCPACNQRLCRVLWKCRDCGAEFVAERTATVLACPKCGSQEVGSAAAP